jgi:hypothetical protein
MKQLQRLTRAAVLVLAVTMSAFAGEIPIPGAVPPPPPPASALSTTPGEIPTGGAGDAAGLTTQLLEELALDLLQRLLSVY